MTRGLRWAWPWRRALWIRESPGVLGGSALLCAPLLYFLPLEGMAFFGERLRGISVLSWLFSMALGLALRGAAPLRNDSAIWTVQKGLSPGELAIEDWLLDLSLILGFSLWWSVISILAHGGGGPETLRFGLAILGLSLATGLVTHSLTLLLSALGLKRPSDPTVLLALISILSPVLTMEAPAWMSAVVEWMIPPFYAAIELSGAIRGMSVGGITEGLLHLLLYSGLLLGIGVVRISAWRPVH